MNTPQHWFYNEAFDSTNYNEGINWPKISIVTPTYNYGHLIEETILSVLAQNYPNLEFIIIDGASKDNTVDIIKKYEQNLAFWISEKDTGQPSAINKGLAKCTGEIFNWVNSDDYLTKGALYNIAKAFENKDTHVVAGKVRYFDDHGFEEINQNQFLSAEGVMCWRKNVQFIQPGVWMRLNCLKAIGGVNEDQKMRFAFDWDMIIRYLYHFPNVNYISDVLMNYRFHPVSNTISDPARYGIEEAYIIEQISKNPKYEKLLPSCRLKIKRRKWTEYLWKIGTDNSKTRVKKIVNILSHLHRQPWKEGVPRMTAGAIKQILFLNKINNSKNL